MAVWGLSRGWVRVLRTYPRKSVIKLSVFTFHGNFRRKRTRRMARPVQNATVCRVISRVDVLLFDAWWNKERGARGKHARGKGVLPSRVSLARPVLSRAVTSKRLLRRLSNKVKWTYKVGEGNWWWRLLMDSTNKQSHLTFPCFIYHPKKVWRET